MPIAARSPNGVLLTVCALALLATGCGDSSDGNTPTDSTTGGTLGSGATGGVSANGAGDAGATGSGGAPALPEGFTLDCATNKIWIVGTADGQDVEIRETIDLTRRDVIFGNDLSSARLFLTIELSAGSIRLQVRTQHSGGYLEQGNTVPAYAAFRLGGIGLPEALNCTDEAAPGTFRYDVEPRDSSTTYRLRTTQLRDLSDVTVGADDDAFVLACDEPTITGEPEACVGRSD